jgi:cob(I)alamin adenosyltransferase
MSIATKTGDSGETSLLFGTRVSKDHIRVEAYGAIDELNAALGICRSHEKKEENKNFLLEIQKLNFTLGAELAAPAEKLEKLNEKIGESHLERLDEKIKDLEKDPDILKNWHIPGEDPLSSFYDMARCICRRAERNIVTLAQEVEVSPVILRYINRLSDCLWLMGVTAAGK